MTCFSRVFHVKRKTKKLCFNFGELCEEKKKSRGEEKKLELIATRSQAHSISLTSSQKLFKVSHTNTYTDRHKYKKKSLTIPCLWNQQVDLTKVMLMHVIKCVWSIKNKSPLKASGKPHAVNKFVWMMKKWNGSIEESEEVMIEMNWMHKNLFERLNWN